MNVGVDLGTVRELSSSSVLSKLCPLPNGAKGWLLLGNTVSSLVATEGCLWSFKGPGNTSIFKSRIVSSFPFSVSPQNEMDDVPFFDIQQPYELAINIFQYLDRKDLGRCAQVSCH